MQFNNVREGFVSIHRKGANMFEFRGLEVLGRGRPGSGTQIGNRTVVPAHNSEPWFLQFCNQYADTPMKVRVRVVKLVGGYVAEAKPMASDKEEALKEYVQRYGSSSEDGSVDTSFDVTFQIHEHVAKQNNLKVVEHICDGLKSRTSALAPNGAPCKIIGGMLVAKVVRGFRPDNQQWITAVKSFVRVHPT